MWLTCNTLPMMCEVSVLRELALWMYAQTQPVFVKEQVSNSASQESLGSWVGTLGLEVGTKDHHTCSRRVRSQQQGIVPTALLTAYIRNMCPRQADTLLRIHPSRRLNTSELSSDFNSVLLVGTLWASLPAPQRQHQLQQCGSAPPAGTFVKQMLESDTKTV